MKKIVIIAIVIMSFQTIYSQEISKETEERIWKFIDCNFVYASKTTTTIYVYTYPRDIAINLEGNVSREDSICFNELISQVKPILRNRKIFLSDAKLCLVFHFTDKKLVISTPARVGSDLYYHHIYIYIPKNVSQDLRKKIIYYHFYNSLVYPDINHPDCIPIEGCVFSENDPEKITYSPYDSIILAKLYANDFLEQYKKRFPIKTDSRSYLLKRYSFFFSMILFDIGLLIGIIFFMVYLAKRTRLKRKMSWLEYNKIGLYLILIVFILIYFVSFRDVWIVKSKLTLIINYLVRAFAAINIIYFADYFIYRKGITGGLRLFLIFLITFSVPFIAFVPNWQNISIDRLNLNLSPFFLLGAFVRVLYIFLNDRYNSMINQKDVELAKISELHKNAQLQSLQAKINPHFLYNALSSIATLARSDARKTEQMALSLSDFYKYALNRAKKQFNSCSEELNAVRTYLEIEKVRFGERLNFEIDCPEELKKFQIPQLIIQPLVENAVKHGLSQIRGKGIIRVIVRQEDNQLSFKVYDNGPPFHEGPLSGYGIQNIHERITLLYGEKASINWNNTDQKYIELKLPIIK